MSEGHKGWFILVRNEGIRLDEVDNRLILRWAIRVHGSGSCQPGRPDNINGADTNRCDTWPEHDPINTTNNRITRLPDTTKSHIHLLPNAHIFSKQPNRYHMAYTLTYIKASYNFKKFQKHFLTWFLLESTTFHRNQTTISYSQQPNPKLDFLPKHSFSQTCKTSRHHYLLLVLLLFLLYTVREGAHQELLLAKQRQYSQASLDG
jgi:hypothetical protein